MRSGSFGFYSGYFWLLFIDYIEILPLDLEVANISIAVPEISPIATQIWTYFSSNRGGK